MSRQAPVSGLGIDMGTPSTISSGNSECGGSISRESRHQRPKQQQQAQQQQRPRSMQLPESLNQYNDRRRAVASQRQSNPAASRTSRLGDAIAALDEHRGWETQSSATSSDVYGSDASPDTESSATTHSSGYRSSGSNSLKRTQTVRKQMSQPNMAKAASILAVGRNTETDMAGRDANQAAHNPPPRNMLRSKSSMSLSSHYHQEENAEAVTLTRAGVGSRSLGRSAEIPRSGSRGGAMMRSRTVDSAPRRDGMGAARITTADAEEEVARRGSNGKLLVPDGFGGFVEAADQSAAEQPSRASRPEEQQAIVQRTSMQQQPQQWQQAPAQPVHRPHSRQEQPVHSTAPSVRPRSHTVSERPAPSLRIGSFYGPNGEERSRIDMELAHSQSSQTLRRDSISHESSNGVSDAGSHASSTASSQRSAGPRLQFMASPGSAHEGRRGGSSVVSGSTGISTSIADGNVQGLMRSVSGFHGLRGAEHGETMVSFDAMQRAAGSGFDVGEAILPGQTRGEDDESILLSAHLAQKRDSVATIDRSFQSLSLSRHHKQHQQHPSGAPPTRHVRQASAPAGMMGQEGSERMTKSTSSTTLERHGTLIAAHSNPARRSRDLSRLLANSNGKLPASSSSDASTVISSCSSYASLKQANANALPHAVLEQGKTSKSRVDVDLVLESELIVEGGVLSGRLEVKVRKNTTREGHLMLCQPKVRVVGFEELLNDDTRHIFYHYATVIDGSPKIGNAPNRPYVLHGSPNLSSPESDNRRPLACFASTPDSEGYSVAKEGSHSIPFSLELPVGKGAKGSYRGKHAVVRYIVIGSVKLKNANGTNHSIAHFYRHIDIFPYLNPALVLSTSNKPIAVRASKGLFLGGPNKVHLQASIHRNSWIAGQRLYVHLRIDNQTNKKVKSLALALVRTVVLYRPRPELDMALKAAGGSLDNDAYIDPDACTTSTSRKKISEDVLELGQKGAKGTVTAKGWWTGVEPGDSVEFSHNVKLPADALTIARGRHVEVLYSLKVSVGSSLSSDVSVELPVRIVNFVSLDPPPLKSGLKAMNIIPAASEEEEPMIERVRSMDALRSPRVDSPQPAQNDGRYLNVARHVQGMQSTRNTSSRNTLQVEDESTMQQRRLQHQKSLDFINHAIRSATARRGGSTSSNEPSPTGLGIEVDQARTPLAESTISSGSSTSGEDASSVSGSEAVHPSCRPYQHKQYPPIVSLHGVVGGPRAIYMPSHTVSVDDAEYDEEDDFDVGEQTLNLNDESVADIDTVIGSAHVDGGESSPEFQQRRGMESFGGDVTMNSEDEGDMSGMTVTSNDAGEYTVVLDEFDEEEERIERLHRHIESRRMAVVPVDLEDDGGPTPLAKSPPKFQSNLSRRDSYGSAASSASESGASSVASSSLSSQYSAAAIQEAKREGKAIVRTRSDLEQRLGRSSTIIRGPSNNPSRPVSPSKMAPSPTKSAMKRSATSSVVSEPQSWAQSGLLRGTAPLQIRARIADGRGQAQPQQQQLRPPLRHNASSNSDAESGYSDSSVSPATSASVSTPREGMSDTESSAFSSDKDEPTRKANRGLGLQMDAVVRPIRMNSGANAAYFSPNAVSPKSKSSALPVASTAAVPSVRDKIAMLESRKHALQELTGAGIAPTALASTPPRTGAPAVPAKDDTPSPSRLARLAVVKQGSGNGTPTRVQDAARSYLQRNNSIVSETSSVTSSAVQPDYLRNIPSMQNFKAPIFRAGGQ